MHTITERDLIRDVVRSWSAQFGYDECGPDKLEKLAGLRKLDAETATADDVEAIIGNRSWTRLTCNECGRAVCAVVEVGEEQDYESRTARLCFDCIGKAADLAHNA